MSLAIARGRRTGPTEHDEVAALHEKVREARLELARKTRSWEEIEETALVRRGRFLVHAHTDELFVLRGGEVFERGRASVGYVADGWEMHYFVDQAGEIVFLERQQGTWSEIVARQARKGRA